MNPARLPQLFTARPALDAALAAAARGVQAVCAGAGAEWQSAAAELQRVHSVLGMLGLRGMAVFCAELKTQVQELAAVPSPQRCAAVQRALRALAHYLESLAQGGSDIALRLFPEYQEMLQARGVELAFESDLFFPELEVELPQEVLEGVTPPEMRSAELKLARSQYQQGLLNWLRAEQPQAALAAMQAALGRVRRTLPADGTRALWWVAEGLLQGLAAEAIPSDLNVRRLLRQLDQHIKALLDGKVPDPERELYEMLYLLAQCREAGGTVQRIREVYALARYLPQAGSLDLAVLKERLAEMRQAFDAASVDWEQCLSGDMQAGERFLQHSGQLLALTQGLEPDTLQFLCREIDAAARAALGHHDAQRIAAELAMALLLLEQGIAHYPNLDGDYHELARQLAARLQQAVAGQAPAWTPQLAAPYARLQRQAVWDVLAGELQHDLEQLEQGLQPFLEDARQQAGLAGLERRLAEVGAGLHLVGQAGAAKLAAALHRVLDGLAERAAVSSAEAQAVALAVSTLGQCVGGLSRGLPPPQEALEQALQALQAGPAAAPPAVAASAAAPSAMPGEISDEEQELLEVFLEEAREAMHSLREQLALSRSQPGEREHLAIMRRSFHTLKGSGRMVGLMELGEVAWAVERALNHCLQLDQPVSAEVLDMILAATELFQSWVDALATSRNAAAPDARALLAAAKAIETDQPLPAAPAPPVPAAEAPATAAPAAEPSAAEAIAVEPAPQEEQVVIGAVRLSPDLFAIATEEAAAHVARLQHFLEEVRHATPLCIPYDFMRAAHTLAGVNRTMGFTAVAELAYALEQWLEERVDKALEPDAAQLALLEQVIAALDGMCRAVRARQEPEAQAELLRRLQEGKERYRLAQAKAAAPLPPSVPDEVDEQLLPIFLEEADELYPKIAEGLRQWRITPEAAASGHSLQRLLHTFKGSARMAGALQLGELIHHMEGRIEAAQQQGAIPAGLWDELEEQLDRIGQALDALRQPAAAPAAAQPVAPPPAAAQLRVAAAAVDLLVNEAGEISVARARAETALAEIKSGVLELTDSVNRLRRQLREIEIQAEGQMQAQVSASAAREQFDPLEFDRFTRFQELTRFVNESVHDVQTIQQTLLKSLGESEAALNAQALRNRELQQELMALRMVPFSSIAERLYRIVRQTAKELGKRANLELSGGEVELDRSVLERITAPLEHLLRNAVAHGLEAAAQRAAAGKRPIGEIRLAVQQAGNEVVFQLSDDGAGLDLVRLREKGEALGLLQAGEEISDEQLMQLIFQPGFSTAEEVSEIAGRGVGLDVVRSEIHALGGRIDLASEAGRGLRFTLHLPLTLAMTRVLGIRAAQTDYALPTALVEQVQQLKPDVLEQGYREGQLHWQGQDYPLFHLARLLGKEQAELVARPHNPVLLLRSGGQRLAVHVDELLGKQEVVVKNIGPQLARLPGIAGATLAGDGSVVLLLNPLLLAQRTVRVRKAQPSEAVRKAPVVMVVDDSLTVRKITGKLLQRAGYQVMTAKDGVDALEQMMDFLPALVLLDVEMPRMDGFELAQRLRQEARTRALPIIMITSRTADKHRDYALGLGVNAYLGKPYQEEELLAQIRTYLGATA